MTARFLALLAALVLATLAAPAGAQCRTDEECSGENICTSGVCKTPRLWELFPSGSTPSPDQDRYVIKTTPNDCDARKGQYSPKLVSDSMANVRCALPRGVTPSTKAR